MNFKIKFRSKGHRGEGAISFYGGILGLNHLDIARKSLGVPGLFAGLVNDHLEHTMRSHTVEVDESYARSTEHFCESCEISVMVPNGFLNRFCDHVPVATRAEDDDSILRVDWRTDVSNDAILLAWKDAGFPLYWSE